MTRNIRKALPILKVPLLQFDVDDLFALRLKGFAGNKCTKITATKASNLLVMNLSAIIGSLSAILTNLSAFF